VQYGRRASTGQNCAQRTAAGGMALTRAERRGRGRQLDRDTSDQTAAVSAASLVAPVGSGPSWNRAWGANRYSTTSKARQAIVASPRRSDRCCCYPKVDLKVSGSILKCATLVRLIAVRLTLLSRFRTSPVIHGSTDLFNGRMLQPTALIDAEDDHAAMRS